MDPAWLRRRYLTDRARVADIAAEAGVDQSSVHRALRRHGISQRGPAGRQQWADVLTREYLTRQVVAGVPVRQIAEQVGCDPSTVRRWMQRHGLVVPELTGAQARRLRRWYVRDRLPIVEIARREQVSTQTARACLLAAGVTLRRPGRPKGAPPATGR